MCAANIEPIIVKILNLNLNLTATLTLIPNLSISLTVTFNPAFNLNPKPNLELKSLNPNRDPKPALDYR